MMAVSLLESLEAYGHFVVAVVERPSIHRSTLTVWSTSPFTGTVEGEIFFAGGYRLRMREELDFEAALITAYGYEVYLGVDKLYWYDDFPHPNDPVLASTYPHHKHVPPDIKHNRIPAPGIYFEQANLLFLIAEVEKLIQQSQNTFQS